MMKRFLPLLYLALIVLVLVFAALNRRQPPAALAVGEPVPMSLPTDYRERFVLYLQVDRVDLTVRHVYVLPESLEAIAAGETLPYGTQIIIEAYHAQLDIFGKPLEDENGRFVAGEMFPQIHMMEKRDNWTVDDLPSPVGVIEWNFASFNYDSFLPSTENRNDCLTCHDSAAFRRDLVFSRRFMEAYALSEEMQYLYCHLPERANCIR